VLAAEGSNNATLSIMVTRPVGLECCYIRRPGSRRNWRRQLTQKHRRRFTILLRILLLLQSSLPSFTLESGPCMNAHQYTRAEYALQRVVKSFGTLHFKLAKHHLSHTYPVSFLFCQLKDIDYMGLRSHNTGALLFE